MKKNCVLLAALVFSGFTFASTNAPTVNVEWKETQNYSDINAGRNESKRKFQKRLFSTLERTFAENSTKLPSDLTLEVTVLDIDLAGKTNGFGVRSITDYDFPAIQFYVVIKDAKGDIVLQGLQNLKERKDKHKAFRMYGSQSEFYLETSLIEKWFDLALAPRFAKLD